MISKDLEAVFKSAGLENAEFIEIVEPKIIAKNIEIIGNAWDAAAGCYDAIRDIVIEEEPWDDDGDDYERHMMFECRMDRFV